jgi:hypothetical protein
MIFSFLSISQLLKLFYFSTISYLDIWEKINNLFTDGNREKIISSWIFIFVSLGKYDWFWLLGNKCERHVPIKCSYLSE